MPPPCAVVQLQPGVVHWCPSLPSTFLPTRRERGVLQDFHEWGRLDTTTSTPLSPAFEPPWRNLPEVGSSSLDHKRRIRPPAHP